MRRVPDVWCKIESMVKFILDDINKRHPNTIDELLPTPGPRKKERGEIVFEGHLAAKAKVLEDESTNFELLRASLGIIFQERYGWDEEEIDSMTFPEVFIALEHAMAYDAPSKKSVWNL